MTPGELAVESWGLLTRFLPWSGPTGLVAIGSPDADSPVLISGNYRVTIQRLRRGLRGLDVWLLVVDSRGINAWCAAAGGHLGNSQVISGLRTSGVADKVSHRRAILPQLAATGVEPALIQERTGWQLDFGPVRIEDIPAFLERGSSTRSMRTVRFELPARLEMSAMWGWPIAVIGLLVAGLAAGPGAGACVALGVLAAATGLFAALPLIPGRGLGRWWSGLGSAALFFLVSAGLWRLLNGQSSTALLILGAVALGLGALLVMDLAGSTPTLGSDMHKSDRFAVEVRADRCDGVAVCVRTCPRNVLEVHAHKVEQPRAEDCVRCGACIVQCPHDALRFRFDDGSVVEPAVVRSTKLNLLGKRSVQIEDRS